MTEVYHPFTFVLGFGGAGAGGGSGVGQLQRIWLSEPTAFEISSMLGITLNRATPGRQSQNRSCAFGSGNEGRELADGNSDASRAVNKCAGTFETLFAQPCGWPPRSGPIDLFWEQRTSHCH